MDQFAEGHAFGTSYLPIKKTLRNAWLFLAELQKNGETLTSLNARNIFLVSELHGADILIFNMPVIKAIRRCSILKEVGSLAALSKGMIRIHLDDSP